MLLCQRGVILFTLDETVRIIFDKLHLESIFGRYILTDNRGFDKRKFPDRHMKPFPDCHRTVRHDRLKAGTVWFAFRHI